MRDAQSSVRAERGAGLYVSFLYVDDRAKSFKNNPHASLRTSFDYHARQCIQEIVIQEQTADGIGQVAPQPGFGLCNFIGAFRPPVYNRNNIGSSEFRVGSQWKTLVPGPVRRLRHASVLDA